MSISSKSSYMCLINSIMSKLRDKLSPQHISYKSAPATDFSFAPSVWLELDGTRLPIRFPSEYVEDIYYLGERAKVSIDTLVELLYNEIVNGSY